MRTNSDSDLRIIKNNAAIQKAFRDLINEKKIKDINVSEIVKKAQISRRTFYAHYSDKYQLMHELLLQKLDMEKSQIDLVISNGDIVDEKVLYNALLFSLKHFDNHAEIYAELIELNSISVYNSKVCLYFVEMTKKYMMAMLKDKGENAKIDWELFSKFYAFGCIDLALDWVKSGKERDIDDLALQMTHIIMYSFIK